MRRSELHVAIEERLTAGSQRYTPARRALIDTLADADAPLTIVAIAEREAGLTQSSTYRNLALLESLGLVRRIVTTTEHASYELAEDLTRHHHHLICTTCGTVRDFVLSDELEEGLERALRRIASRNDFDVNEHRLDLVGICAACG